MSYHILLTIDVEDWFQVENFKPWIPFSSWDNCELRVEKNTHRILDILDGQQSAVSDQQSAVSKKGGRPPNPDPRSPIRGTFFVLGWLAKRLPNLVREIHERGHEVASHGYYHRLCTEQSTEDLKEDLIKSKELLEDIIGAPVYGYRAPSFSINKEILTLIRECGYLYDSSYNSFNMHSRYGQLDLSQNKTKGIAIEIHSAFRKSLPKVDKNYELSPMPAPWNLSAIPSGSHEPLSSKRQNPERKAQNPVSSIQYPVSIFYEFPISNLTLNSHTLPWGGGAYFRLIPFPLFKQGVQSILKREGTYLLYLHPWEIDPEQPRVDNASTNFKFRHYTNLNKSASKLSWFLTAFEKCRFFSCHQYLKEML